MLERSSDDALLASVRENYSRLTDRIGEICAKNGITRPVTVCAATKTVSPEVINYAAGLGLSCMGENRVQELVDKYDALSPALEKHFIGHLQTNKIKYLMDRVSMIQSLDSLRAAAEIQRLCERDGKEMRVLVEINIGREPNKSGVLPEQIPDFLDGLDAFSHVKLCGAMTICPICDKKDDYKKFFAETYQIFIDFFAKKLHNIDDSFLSMGMSDNYELALEYGANMIRPGRAIFGARN